MSKVFVFLKDVDTSHMAEDRREAWMPRGGGSYFDKAARRTFESRKEKRQWLKVNGMRECGELMNPEKHILGREKSKPSPHKEAIQRYLHSQGGTAGLLQRIQEQRGNFL